MDIDVHSALRVAIRPFLEGEFMMLADMVEVNDPKSLEMHKSRLELWRLLKCNFDGAQAFNVTNVLSRVSATHRPRRKYKM